MEAGLGKESVRSLALRLGLDNWAKPSSPCLSSRFPYGERITLEKLGGGAGGRGLPASAGVRQLPRAVSRAGRSDRGAGRRVCPACSSPTSARGLIARFKELGFAYVTVDLEGFRSGSMNEVLSAERGSA